MSPLVPPVDEAQLPFVISAAGRAGAAANLQRWASAILQHHEDEAPFLEGSVHLLMQASDALRADGR
eukprot:8686467-Alexandrium_andersonii.AAC.1